MTSEEAEDLVDNLVEVITEDDVIELLVSVNRVGASLLDITSTILDTLVQGIPEKRH